MSDGGVFPTIASSRLSLSTVLLLVCGVVTVVVAGIVYVSVTQPTQEHVDRVKTDPVVFDSLILSKDFSPARDVPGCLRARLYRCFQTQLDGATAATFLTTVLQATGYEPQAAGPEGYTASYLVCGQLEGAPAFALVRPSPKNAIHTGPGSWQFPRNDDGETDGFDVLVSVAGDAGCG